MMVIASTGVQFRREFDMELGYKHSSNSTLFRETRSSLNKGGHHADCVCFFLAGEFIKYHDLKENDAMLLYEDASGRLVSHSFLPKLDTYIGVVGG